MSQQIYLPLSGAAPIPYEFDADTMMVPRGQSSVLYELRDGNLTAAEAIVYLCLNHGSTWNSGATWSMSGPYLSKILGTGMSRSYVVKTLANLSDKGWIETIDEDNPSGNRYRLRHHLCPFEDVPVDKDGKPLKFAVPRGAGGPLERCFDGDISWKAALAWISLKLRSNWKAHADTAGQTESEVAIQLEGTRRHRRTNGECQTHRPCKKVPDRLTQLSEPYHRVDARRHAGTADTQITTSDLSVVSQALPETCPAQPRDTTRDGSRESHQNRW